MTGPSLYFDHATLNIQGRFQLLESYLHGAADAVPRNSQSK